MLKIDGLHAGYGSRTVLWELQLEVGRHDVVSVIGANGVGKTTLLRTVSGLLRPSQGEIYLEGERVTDLGAEDLVARGVVHVPEGRQLFSGLSVRNNLLMGAFTRHDRSGIARDAEWVLSLFPELNPLLHRQAGLLSGGEQQMVAIGRGLMANPRLLLIDEFSLGLAPVIVDRLARLIRQIHQERDITILLVEQDVQMALDMSDRGVVLENGRIARQGTCAALLADDEIRRIYLGV
jgi:branched-chain amino acid transport system ATP-binding protein